MAHRFVDHTGEVELHVEAASEEAVSRSTSSCTSRRWTGSSPPASSNKGVAKEAPFAYKDVDAIVDVVVRAPASRGESHA